ncbi:GNAT family N-acetyltransferase [Micromonospora sagamiensis]|uniref:RimJ/RimL family protein N-acetyltransferase n=1 Tax=Micromonospora sagamiensis TaxID=47875 RepID=A0A562WKI5_9ACTN|nr:GNAT family N-acetyltransferase [Micromonospora sagamiensis]TWJ30706.1 RimJ/RimL family protein N-acetyltransferase [Micromonospora sagamiensis]BCL16259.1 N-acetyltransferase [Micromonospora sagamiensis]
MAVITETERLLVRPWTREPADLDALYDMYSRPEVVRWFGGGILPLTAPEQAVELLRRWELRGSRDGWYDIWAVELRGTGQVVGTTMIKQLPGPDDPVLTDDIEVGWHLHPDHWGHGYATEAARALIDREFAHTPTETIHAVVHPGNEPSKAVARRLGMSYVGLRTDWYGGTEVDTFVLHRPTPG